MFWKINFRQPSAIDGLLDKEDCTLSEILDEDDVLQECKTQNKKLIDFLIRPENLEQLIHYVCDEPNSEDEDKVRFKYPHLACEILTAEIFAVIECLTTNDTYLPMLWAFLDNEPPINPLTGSFISKVLSMLLNQRTAIYLEYIQKREGFTDSFLRHLGTSAMMDLLLQMIVSPDGDQQRINLAYWLKDNGVIEKLIDFIHPSAGVNQCINASQAICDMIRISRDTSQMSGPSPLLATLESEDTIERLLKNIFDVNEPPPDWTVINGVAVILTALEKRMGGPYSPTFGQQPQEDSSSSWDEAVERTLSATVSRIKLFHELLLRKSDYEPVLCTVGLLDPPLGNMRLQVVHLFSALLHTQDVRIQREIIRNKTCTVLMDLFFQYPWNNFLHMYVESFVTAALSSTSPVPMEMNDDTGQSDETITLRQHLLSECNLVQRLLEGAEKNENIIEAKGCRQGYMGHLIRMVNQIAGNTRALALGTGTVTRTGDDVTMIEDNTLQSELDDATFQRWSEFLLGPLADMNKKNDTNLGGTRPLTCSIDSDEEFDPLHIGPDNELEKAYQHYQDVRFSNTFMDDFGLDDDLDPAQIPYTSTYDNITSISCSILADEKQTEYMAGFDAACSDRIRQFDDESESDEEESNTWIDKDIPFGSPGEHHSPDSTSGDEEEGSGSRQREFRTESSDDEDDEDEEGVSERRRKPLIIEEKQNDNSPTDLGVISWTSEFTTDEDLSGVTPIKTTGNSLDWTQEPTTNTTSENWANFTSVSFGKKSETNVTSNAGDNPHVVNTTYVAVENESVSVSQYKRLSSDEDNEMIVDQNLLQIVQRSPSDSSEDEDINSSDDERSYNFEGDSGNPLLDSSPLTTPTKDSEKPDDSNSPSYDNPDTELLGNKNEIIKKDEEKELAENYKFLSKQGLLSDNKKIPNKTTTDINHTQVDELNRTENQSISSETEDSKDEW